MDDTLIFSVRPRLCTAFVLGSPPAPAATGGAPTSTVHVEHHAGNKDQAQLGAGDWIPLGRLDRLFDVGWLQRGQQGDVVQRLVAGFLVNCTHIASSTAAQDRSPEPWTTIRCDGNKAARNITERFVN